MKQKRKRGSGFLNWWFATQQTERHLLFIERVELRLLTLLWIAVTISLMATFSGAYPAEATLPFAVISFAVYGVLAFASAALKHGNLALSGNILLTMLVIIYLGLAFGIAHNYHMVVMAAMLIIVTAMSILNRRLFLPLMIFCIAVPVVAEQVNFGFDLGKLTVTLSEYSVFGAAAYFYYLFMNEFDRRLESEVQAYKAESRARDAVEKALDALAKLSSMVSHETRVPLDSAVRKLKLLIVKVINHLPEKQKNDSLQIVKAAIEAIGDATGTLTKRLTLSKLQAGGQSIELKPLNIHEYFSRMVKEKGQDYEMKNLQLEVEIAADVPEYFVLDEHSLNHIFPNLLGNAYKFTAQGGVTIRLSMRGNDLLVEVADTGRGIPADIIPHIFDSYTQVKRSDVGTGLGLSIIKEFMDLFKGKVWIESEEGKGTSFFLLFPAEIV